MPRKPPVRSDPPLDRGQLLAELREAGVPTSPEELARALGVKRRDQDGFAAALDEAVRAGDILVNRKGELLVAAKLDLVRGRVQGHPDGFGFLVPDAGGEDLFLSPREMHKALHGDRVAARVSGTDRRGRPEGEIVEVLERVNKQVVGRLHEAHGAWFVEAEDRRLSQDILVGPEDRGGARAGEVVVLELTQQPSENVEAAGRVVEVLGNATDPGMEIEIALRKHALPFQFSEAAKAQAAALPRDVRAADRRGREDLRGLPLVTIDGETARDFDDAVYCERKGKGFRLVVAIADVSHYVRDGDALDRDARERGTSVYFPRRVIPMLPEELSNELCSLRPNVDRLCMVCDMDIAADGAIKRYRFYPAVMHSRARLTYTRVWQWLSDPAGSSDAEARALGRAARRPLRAVQGAGRGARGARGHRLRYRRARADLRRRGPHRAHRADRAQRRAPPDRGMHAGRQRVHGRLPRRAQARGAVPRARGTDAREAGGAARVPRQLRAQPRRRREAAARRLREAAREDRGPARPGAAADGAAALASHRPSTTRTTSGTSASPSTPTRTSPRRSGATRTSPCTARSRPASPASSYVPKGTGWEALGAHCSMTERRADDATRDVERWLKCWFMKDRIGEEFDGTISGVAGFGIFVTLDGMNVDGLVHVTELGRDYFQFDKVRHALVGERSGRVYQLAGRVRVRVVRVDLETTKIDFVPVETEAPREVPGVLAAARRPAQGPQAASLAGAPGGARLCAPRHGRARAARIPVGPRPPPRRPAGSHASRHPALPVGHPRHAAGERRARQGSHHRVAAPRRGDHRCGPLRERARPPGRAPLARDRDDRRRRAREAHRAGAARSRRAGDRGDRHRHARRARSGGHGDRDSDGARRAAHDEPRGHPPPRRGDAGPADVPLPLRHQPRGAAGGHRRHRRPAGDRLPVRGQARHVVVRQGPVGRARRAGGGRCVAVRGERRTGARRPRDRRELHRLRLRDHAADRARDVARRQHRHALLRADRPRAGERRLRRVLAADGA